MSSLSIQKSIRLSAKAVEVICEVSQDKVNYSGSINSLIERYRLMVDRDLPTLTKSERLAVTQAYNEHNVPLHDIEREVDILPLQVAHAYQNDARVKAFFEQDDGFDIERFINRIHGWGFGQKMAVLHHILTTWNKELASEQQLVNL